MVNTITKADFAEYVDIPHNFPDSRLLRHIKDAARFQLKPALNSQKLYNALIETQITEFSALDDFWKDYVKPFWVYAAFCEFELRHGIDVTQMGMKQHIDSTSDNITDKQRSELLASDKSKRNVYEADMLRELANQNRTFDDEYYPEDKADKVLKNKGQTWKINAVAPTNREYCYATRRGNFATNGGGKIDYNDEDYG